MSSPVNLPALPPAVFDTVFTQENVRGPRSSMNAFPSLSFPKSRAALWDGGPVGEEICLQLFSNRNPRLVLLEKALRLAQRHLRQSDKPHLQCFFLGSVLVDSDEVGVTVTLDRFDPGRDQPGSSGRVPCTVLPGDVLVPCVFVTRGDTSDAVVQSESELHQCFQSLQQLLTSRQNLDLCQLVKVKGRIVCSQQCDATAFSLSWSSVCPSVGLDVQAVRAVPIIPTALLRSLTSTARPLPHPSRCQRGFLTMDQSRKLLLLLESDPKARSLPLVGLWLSGVTHVSSPHVWVSCLHFLFSSALLDRVFSDGGCFLLVLFCSTHKSPQFFQCGKSGRGPDYQLMTAFQHVTLYQVGAAEGQSLLCELSCEGGGRQRDVFRLAQLSFSSSSSPAAVCDQDSGVDEDLSPRPSPSPHLPQQVRRVQPSVPELSLLVDNSFSTHTHTAAPAAAWGATVPSCGPQPSPHHPPHHSTPNPGWQQPCRCCTSHSCTSIRSSPRFFPAASPESPQQKSPPPPPPSSHQKSPPPPPPSSHQKSPPPPSSHQKSPPPPPPSSHQKSPPPPSSQQKSPPPPPPSSHQKSPPPPPPSSHQKSPPPPSSHQKSPPPPPPSSHQKSPPPPSSQQKSPPPPPPSSHQKSPPPPPSSHQKSPPPPSSHQKSPPPPSSHQKSPPPPPSSHQSPPPPSSHHHTRLSSTHHHAAPPLLPSPSIQNTPPSPLSAFPPLPKSPPSPWTASALHSAPPSLHPGDAPHHCTSYPADPAAPPWILHPPYVNRCWDQAGVVETYQLLLQQDQQLRLLQSQVQMLLEAQGRLQPPVEAVRTASVAVGTGTSLFWADPGQPASALEAPARPPETPPLLSSPTCSHRSPSDANLSVIRPVGGAEDGSSGGQEVGASAFEQASSSQSPVLGESVSMCSPSDDNPNFYKDLMSQLTSRLQEADSREEEEALMKSSVSAPPDHSQSSQVEPPPRRRPPQPSGDRVVSATLQELRRLGVSVDEETLTERDRKVQQTAESSSTLASINPAAVVSRLRLPEGSFSSLLPCGSVDLSLEANAIALRYLSQAQLRGHAPSSHSLLSPSNMSVATRKYMKKYGLMEEELEEDRAELERSPRTPLAEPRPQSQLIKDLQPQMQLLTEAAGLDRRPSARRPEGSVGNILDLSRLRQLPKLF